MDYRSGGPWRVGRARCQGAATSLSSHACVPNLRALATAWAPVTLEEPVCKLNLAPWAGDGGERVMGEGAQRHPLPLASALGDTLSWRWIRGILGTAGTGFSVMDQVHL